MVGIRERVTRHMVRALGKRDLRRYFSNPTGYVFITLFIFLSAAAAFWQPRFFLNNLANLDQLNRMFPYLLLFFIPALTMGIWSDERKQGTDELLLTLPARDADVVLGKYVAVLGIYTGAVFLSLSHVVVLAWLGSPDRGLLAGNYLGYWLAGAALIPVGMLASQLTSNGTVAFVMGSAFCSLPISIGAFSGLFSPSIGRRLAPLGITTHFDEFARGTVSLTGLLYFITLAGVFLYFNVVLLGRRHWSHTGQRPPMWVHYLLRAGAVLVALIAANVIISRADVRADVTAERLHSLSPETYRLIRELPLDRPVLIQAFISPDVPEMFVQTRENLLSALTEIGAIAGAKVQVAIENTEPYSEAARTARERFGIPPRLVADPSSARGEPQEMYLGVAFTSGAEEQVIPFFERGLSAEYEIARTIRVVARTSRKKIGVVDTDAKLFGGVDFQTGRPRVPWAIVDEIRRQYDVVELSPSEPIVEPVDALLVVLPSTLLQREMENVRAAILSGVPTLLVVDPVPAVDMRFAPLAAMAARVDPYQRSPTLTKNTGDAQKLLADIGVTWPIARIAWDNYTPHPDLAQMPREAVFVGPGSGSPNAFNLNNPVTSGLQEVLLLYPGILSPVEGAPVTFEPLLESGTQSGTVGYFQLVQPSEAGPVLNQDAPHQSDGERYVLAAQVRSKPAQAPAGDGQGAASPAATRGIDAIVIADLDFISDQFFAIRASGPSAATYDNITFFLNCLDVLAKDDSFIALRKRRLRHRTLEKVEAQTRSFIDRRTKEEQQAEKDAEKALDDARNRLRQMVQAVDDRKDLDAQAKQIMIRNLEATENRRFEVLQVNIDQAKDAKVQGSRETMESQIRRIQSAIRVVAVLVPPVPVFLLGVGIFVRRYRREREGAAAVRRLRNKP